MDLVADGASVHIINSIDQIFESEQSIECIKHLNLVILSLYDLSYIQEHLQEGKETRPQIMKRLTQNFDNLYTIGKNPNWDEEKKSKIIPDQMYNIIQQFAVSYDYLEHNFSNCIRRWQVNIIFGSKTILL